MSTCYPTNNNSIHPSQQITQEIIYLPHTSILESPKASHRKGGFRTKKPIRFKSKPNNESHTNYTMSRFFPQAQYEEDQTLSHTILYTHVITRFVQAGALVGTGLSTSTFLLRKFNILLKPSLTPSTYAQTLLRAGGTGGMVGVGLGIAATMGRMWGREEIEWQERSWRLLANKGQGECCLKARYMRKLRGSRGVYSVRQQGSLEVALVQMQLCKNKF
ncbi:hypothetical protein BGZ60DRAFT_198840 [Tricladium varicosporioides]|nr:hypothetical protein BGZ60DRAFT_198840 [Hymenoscyphus varicosporioides]